MSEEFKAMASQQGEFYVGDAPKKSHADDDALDELTVIRTIINKLRKLDNVSSQRVLDFVNSWSRSKL